MSTTTTAKVMKRRHPFITVDATPFRDTRLSWKAKGLMVYFLDKPEDWEFNLEHIYTQAPDKRIAVASGLNELKKYGYIVRVALREGNRICKYQFMVYEQPVAFPTEKDLHIDKALWEKYQEENKDSEEPLDVTLFAKHIKSLSKAELKRLKENLNISQVSAFVKPQETQQNQQVSQNMIPQNPEEAENMKPQKSQENQQVSQNLLAGNQPLTNNNNTNNVVVDKKDIYNDVLIPESDIELIKEDWEARFGEVLTGAKLLQLQKSCLKGFEKIGFTDATGQDVAIRILYCMEKCDIYNRPFIKGALACVKSALANNWEWGEETKDFVPHQHIEVPKDFVPFNWLQTGKKGDVK